MCIHSCICACYAVTRVLCVPCRDDTVEVVEVHRRNTGRDPFPLLLSRCRLPKTPNVPPVGEPRHIHVHTLILHSLLPQSFQYN